MYWENQCETRNERLPDGKTRNIAHNHREVKVRY